MRHLVVLSLSFAFASASAVVGFLGCGGISDPNRQTGTENVASVSGALTGTSAPSGAHVALVWRSGASGAVHVVLGDTAIVDGRFRIDLTVPPAEFFHEATSQDYADLSGSGSSSISESPSLPPGNSSASPPGVGTSSIRPRDVVSGGIAQPLSLALAGFVVYVDTNGNGKLDLEGQYLDSPDQVIGGNSELLLAYLRDGGQLEYEKLRDRSGSLPHSGFGLALSPGRWVPLDAVELTLAPSGQLGRSTVQLPSTVCGPQPSPVAQTNGDWCNGGPPPAGPDPYGLCTAEMVPFAYGCAEGSDGGFGGTTSIADASVDAP